MQIIRSPQQMSMLADDLRRQDKSIGFVPTLGNLHKGHTKLMQNIRASCDTLVVSIFVNPTQFATGEDMDAYPRTEEEDLQVCKDEGVDLVFIPRAEDIYFSGKHPLTQINIISMTSLHCGVKRPSHFIGVLTIVALLFNLIKPRCAAFGKKDFQQLTLIQIMVKELHFTVEIVPVDTGRTADGLALSSRNRYLTKQERAIAPHFYTILQKVAQEISTGNKGYRLLEKQAVAELQEAGFNPDYIHICRQSDLQPAETGESELVKLVILGAVYLGKARLIDNIVCE